MQLRHWWLLAACVFAAAPWADAAPRRAAVKAQRVSRAAPAKRTAPAARAAVPDRVEVHPARVTLESRRAYRQLVVTGHFGGETRDLTRSAVFRSSNERVARVRGARVSPAGDGRASVLVRVGGRSVSVPVEVSNSRKPDPVRFKFETLAVLTKQGCASGSCHGSPHGKGGFSLSLFGYDPRIDRISLTRDGFNRRVNVLEPAESLILKKPLLQVPHVGGKRLRREAAAYRVLHDWIYEGAAVELPETECVGLEIHPGPARVLRAPHLKQQLSVLARFSDGTVRDVTAIATYDSSHPAVAAVDADGLVTGRDRGQAAISVRYLDRLESVYFTVIRDVPGFAWNDPPENSFIDSLVHAKLRQLQYLPSGTCTDEVFIRRVSLDLTGMLPEPERVRRFLQDRSPGKRAALIDELLETEEYARFWALKKADLMRVSPKKLAESGAESFARWIVDAIRANMPYDRFARELLTAAGETRAVPAASYFLAIPGTEERAEMTAQIFMGSRIECAKCHNHPFENWTMRDYYSIAAVFARTRGEDGAVRLADTGETRHPATGEVMRPWGAGKGEGPADRRAGFAGWLTKPGNPYFARVEVNRIWADLLGRGIVEPVDDFRSSNPPANVPLLDALAREFERSGYDRKRIIRLICNSRTYQRSAETNRFNEGDETLFSHARIRLLTAEQLKDAIGMAARVLPPASALEPRLDALRRQADARAAELEREYPAWLRESAAAVSGRRAWAGAWYQAGPFPHDDFDRALREPLPPETQPVDLAARFEGGRGWVLRPEFRDGAANGLGERTNQVHYFYRRLHASEAGKLTLQVHAKEAAVLWLNGARVGGEPLRGDRRIDLDLRAGENHLLVKAVNGGSPASVLLRVLEKEPLDLPPHVIEFLAVPEEGRTPEQRRLLRAHHLAADGRLRDLRAQISRLESRLDYATQRPYPEPSSFAAAFGQPQRETACTCERQSSPTLLQALELLNGSLAYGTVRAGADVYAPLEDGRLIEELYLSALSRFPTGKERETAGSYLREAKDRREGVMDLLWTLVNTQEFLFQH